MTAIKHAPEGQVSISHPSETEWFLNGFDIFDASRLQEIQQGLGFDDDAMAPVTNALNVANSRTAAYRLTHEKVNLQKLGLNEAEHQAYMLHAKNHENKAGFVRWFSLQAKAYFDAAEQPADKVVLELDGVRQAGYWQTGGLDWLFRRLEADLKGLEPDANMKNFEEAELVDNPIKYKEIPMQSALGGASRLDFVTSRRRRPVTNVKVPGGQVLKVSKESTAVVVIDTLPRDQRIALREQAVKDADISNSEAAVIAGQEFEKAIAMKHNGSEHFGVLPISAHYVATVEAELEL